MICLEITRDDPTPLYQRPVVLELIGLPRREADVIHHGEQQDVRHAGSDSTPHGFHGI